MRFRLLYETQKNRVITFIDKRIVLDDKINTPSVHYINIFSFDFKLISCSTLVIEKPFIPKTLVLNKGSLSCNSAVSYSFYRGHSKMHFTHLYTKAFVHSIVYIFYYFFICQL